MRALEELFYSVGFMLGGILCIIGAIAGGVALGYDQANPDWIGALVSAGLSIGSGVVAAYCWHKMFGTKEVSE